MTAYTAAMTEQQLMDAIVVAAFAAVVVLTVIGLV